MYRKLDSFYLNPELKDLHGYEMHNDNAEQYYRVLENLSDRGLKRDIAREVDVDGRKGSRWIMGDFPRLPRIASEIPFEQPDEGKKWLPLKVEGKSFSDWIQVPERVEHFQEIQDVLDQIHFLETERMKRLENRFSVIAKEDAFRYLLGAICSDGYFQKESMIERFGLNLGKKYKWSKDFGDGVCYCLGKIGIRAHQVSDTTSEYVWDGEKRESKKMVWISKSSLLLNWIKRSCLGFELIGSKSSIDAEWLIDAPEEIRIFFLQGVADADGSVSCMRAEISSNTECEFYSRLYNSLGFHTTYGESKLRIQQVDDIHRAANYLCLDGHTDVRGIWKNYQECLKNQAMLDI